MKFSCRLLPNTFAACLGLVTALTTVAVSAQAQQAFDCTELRGRWTGFGWFHYLHEGRQRARCKFNVACAAGPASGKLALTCKTPGLELDARSQFTVSNDRVNGRWSLPDYNVNGAVSGRATRQLMDVILRVKTQNFGAHSAALKVKIQDGRCRASVNVALDAPIGLKKIDLAVRRC